MLAERVKEWTREWKQEGLEEGRKEGRREEREEALTEGRAALIRELERRFGPLPPEAWRRVAALDSIQRILELSFAISNAPSLAALGLGESRSEMGD